MKPLDRATIAEIAARYAAIVAPDLRAVVVPRGVSAVPVPVWRDGAKGPGLYDTESPQCFGKKMWANRKNKAKPA